MAIGGRGIYRDFDPTLKKSINSGYIIIPSDVDRDKFIEQCLRTERFSIQVEGGGGALHNCYITKSAIRDIKFPVGTQRLGSGVVFFTEPFGGKAIITGVVGTGGDNELNKEDIVTFKKTRGGNYALLSVDGNGQINIDVIGVSQRGKLNINVVNDDFSGEVNIHVKGKINMYTEGDTNITAVDGDINLTTNGNVDISADRDLTLYNKKSSVSITDSGIEISSDKAIVVNGQFNVLYSLVPDAAAILDVSEIGVSKKVKVG